MSPTRTLAPRQLDALREVANIAGGHAATALSQLMDRRVMISVPQLSIATLDEAPKVLGYGGRRVAVVAMHVLGDLSGHLVFLMLEADASTLSDLLLSRVPLTSTGFDELAQSSVTEAGNILGGAYAGALGSLMGKVVMLSIPAFGIEPADGVLLRQRSLVGSAAELALCIETSLTIDGAEPQLHGHMLLMPSKASVTAILEALRLA
ncbi:MAG TPA: chemotaxis protein CheC [Gemmatimonadales bacterium]|nr:chemotaxis protein CheC [Gemmatimonadales bacterium]